ncbi:hypothetical protein SAMN05216436_12937 [bacterium A37T11]|nr:hypothetical protein SAMN05216436_12937 [bacterium A37T11]
MPYWIGEPYIMLNLNYYADLLSQIFADHRLTQFHLEDHSGVITNYIIYQLYMLSLHLLNVNVNSENYAFSSSKYF